MPDLVRKNLSLSEKSIERIVKLRRTLGASSDSEVIRKALILYEKLLEEDAKLLRKK